MTASTIPRATLLAPDLLEHTARTTGYLTSDFEVVGERTVHSTMDTDGTWLRILDLRGPDGVIYRARSAHDSDCDGDGDGDEQILLDIVVGDGHLADERPVFGPMSHRVARTAALNYNRYLAALTR